MGQPPIRVQRARAASRRAGITQFVADFHRDHGYGPSLREVAESIGLSLSSTTYHVGQLAARGELVSEPGKPRSLRVPEPPAVRIEMYEREGG